MSILIRKLRPDEATIYRGVRLNCLKNESSYFGSTYEEDVRTPKLMFETFIEEDSPEHVMFGVFDAEQLVGITGFHRMARQRAMHRGEIVQVYVDPKYRGQNLGETLIRYVLDYAFSLDGIEQVQLSVIASNQAAIHLYEKIGFKTFGLQPNYFKVGDSYLDQKFMQLFKDDYPG